MTTNVVYYGMISERLQCSSEKLALDTTNETLELRDLLEDIHPTLKELSYQIAVNQELTETISPGTEVNEIALLPPFAGG